jgi:hypothetical protein
MLFYKVESLLLFSKQLHLAGNRARAGEPARGRACARARERASHNEVRYRTEYL